VLNDPSQFVLDAFRGHVQELALHTFGCRVLQKALETLTEQQLRPLLDELHKSVPMLIEDAFGSEFLLPLYGERGRAELTGQTMSSKVSSRVDRPRTATRSFKSSSAKSLSVSCQLS
jgi:hypothetical protein